jgi:RNase P subunit RPR2
MYLTNGAGAGTMAKQVACKGCGNVLAVYDMATIEMKNGSPVYTCERCDQADQRNRNGGELCYTTIRQAAP